MATSPPPMSAPKPSLSLKRLVRTIGSEGATPYRRPSLVGGPPSPSDQRIARGAVHAPAIRSDRGSWSRNRSRLAFRHRTRVPENNRAVIVPTFRRPIRHPPRLSGLLLLVPFASIILINFEPGARLLNRERPGFRQGTCDSDPICGGMVGLPPSPGNHWTVDERAQIELLAALCRRTQDWELECLHTDAGDGVSSTTGRSIGSSCILRGSTGVTSLCGRCGKVR